MTIDQLNKLTDEEVNRKVAERMGVKPLSYGWLAYNPETTGIAYQGDFKADVENWLDAGFRRRKDYIVKEDVRYESYTADLNAAFTLVEKLRGEGYEFELANNDYDSTWECTVNRAGSKVCWLMEQPLARAICLSFLSCQEKDQQKSGS